MTYHDDLPLWTWQKHERNVTLRQVPCQGGQADYVEVFLFLLIVPSASS